MRHKLFQLVPFLVVALSGYLAFGQGSLKPGPKKVRTLADYESRTLREIATPDSKSHGLFRFRVRVVYTAVVRPISTASNEVLHRWAQCCAGNPDHYTRSYLNEMQFDENGKSYWLAVQDKLITDLQSELKVGEVMDLLLIRISTPKTNGKKGSVFLAERFRPAVFSDEGLKESLNSIRHYLLSSSAKNPKVELSGPCRMKITESSNTTNVSKAVVFLPLTDLDPLKISILEGRRSSSWDLWLHTIAGKPSIRFMLYQGSPAEGGQANKYSLTFSDRQNAEAMAEAFRRAIDICAGNNFKG